MGDYSKLLMTIFDCTRPMLFVNEDPNYPVSIQGTGFIVRFRKRYFVLTARHVIKGFSFQQVRFQYHPNSSDFVPLQRPYEISGDDSDDTDQYDVIVFSVEDSALDYEKFDGYLPYDLSELDALTIFNPTASYAFRGFPTHLRTTEYEQRRVDMESILADGRYGGPSIRREMHVLRINRAREIASFDGLSGSPIFQINHTDSRISQQAFAGMVVLGTAAAGTLEFLEHRKIIDALTKIVDGDVDPYDK